mgnify:FL=1
MGAVNWAQCMQYERDEAVKVAASLLCQPSFDGDDLSLREIDETVCVSGGDVARRQHGLFLVGGASEKRIALYEQVERITRRVAADFQLRLRFRIGPGDNVPDVPLIPLKDSLQLQAKRLWQRAYWAMRCGIVKRIAETRRGGGGSHRGGPGDGGGGGVNVSRVGTLSVLAASVAAGDDSGMPFQDGSPAGTAPPPTSSGSSATASHPPKALPRRRPFAPAHLYRDVASVSAVGMPRFATSTPCIFLFWASWDPHSVSYLETTLFSPKLLNQAAAATGAAAGHGAHRGGHSSVVGFASDPWVEFATKFIDLRLYSVNAAAANGPSQIAKGERSGAGSTSTKNRVAETQASVVASLNMHETFEAFTGAAAPSVVAGAAAPVHQSTTASRKGAASLQVGSTGGAAPGGGRNERRTAMGAMHGPHHSTRRPAANVPSDSRRRPRLCHIVLVSVDGDAADATAAGQRLHDRIRGWTSSYVPIHFTHAGEGGMHSLAASQFDLHALPAVAVAAGASWKPPADAGGESSSYLPSKCRGPTGSKGRRGGGGRRDADDDNNGADGDGSDSDATDDPVDSPLPRGEFVFPSFTSIRGVGGGGKDGEPSSTSQFGSDWGLSADGPAPRSGFGAHQEVAGKCAAPSAGGGGILLAARRPGSPLRFDASSPDVPSFGALPWSKRSELIASILRVVETHNAKLTLAAVVETEFDIDLGPAAVKHRQSSSAVSIRGIVSCGTATLLQPMLCVLRQSVRNALCDVQVVESANPLRIPMNERRAEHRVKGRPADATCAACGSSVDVTEVFHASCLHCARHRSFLCLSCVAKHDATHVLAVIPPTAARLGAHDASAGTPPASSGASAAVPRTTHAVVWGAGNVSPLPLHRGRLVASESGDHTGVFCNQCVQTVHGVRWRCAQCLEFDLCTFCYDQLARKALSAIAEAGPFRCSAGGGGSTASSALILPWHHPSQMLHHRDHVFLRVTTAVPDDPDVLFTPTVVPIDDHSEAASSTTASTPSSHD